MKNITEYQNPKVNLLNEKVNSQVNENIDLTENITKALKSFGVEITEIKHTTGPTVTLYEIVPAPGVKISKIKSLQEDLALQLKANCRFISGVGTIGLEVSNKNPEIVSMIEVINSEEFINTTMELPIVLGKTIEGKNQVIDLAKMPHLLVAGATGQGKSVGLNVMLTSLLFKKNPNDLKLILIDPKRVELSLYKEAKAFLMQDVVTDPNKAIETLNALCFEMDERYNLLQDAGVRNIKEYNAKLSQLNLNDGHRHLPYVVTVVDEFADLMMTAGKQVEEAVTRIAQLARAVGIHLIIATQRPSVDVITGTIKANLPARIAFKTTSATDSRTIGVDGADQLIGKGDMIFNNGNESIRIQCPFMTTEETENVVKFIAEQDVEVDFCQLITL